MVLGRTKGADRGVRGGEAKEPPLRPTFDRRIKLEFHGAKITSDGGLLAYRELDDALGLTDTAITKLLDGRRGKNTRHKLSGLFRQAVFGRLAGYETAPKPDPRRAGGFGLERPLWLHLLPPAVPVQPVR